MINRMFDGFVEDKTKGLYVPRDMESIVGKAYGFFDCRASKNEIEGLMPKIRKYAQTPPEAQLSLIDDMDKADWDSQLIPIAEKAKKRGNKYASEATYRGATNRDAADEVAQVLIQAYQSNFYEEGEPFRGEVVFKEEGKYIFRN